LLTQENMPETRREFFTQMIYIMHEMYLTLSILSLCSLLGLALL